MRELNVKEIIFCAFGAVCAVIPQIAAITPYVIWNDALNSCAGANSS